MINKELIKEFKQNTEIFNEFIKKSNDKNLIEILTHFGKIDKEFNFDSLVKLTTHKNSKVRILATKNLSKLKNINLINLFQEIVENDTSSDVQREAMSAIGRFKNVEFLPVLFKHLDHANPEVVLQSIRGLLAIRKKKKELIEEKLLSLSNHPNEIVRQIISIETSKSSKKSKINAECKNIIMHGDSREKLKELPEQSVHLTFTSPPYYNARDYSIYKSYQEYLEFLADVFKEVHRVTVEGRFLIVNTSPIIIPRVGRKYSSIRYPIPFDLHYYLTKSGWDFIDDILWVKPEASVKNRNGGFQQHRKPLAYKPNCRTEYVMVYRKKTNKLLDWNIRLYNTSTIEESKITDNFNTSNVWEIDPAFDKVHSAVFPYKLCEEVIKLYSFKNDVICDPFAGSGTVGVTATNMNRYYILIEKNDKYISRIKEKLNS